MNPRLAQCVRLGQESLELCDNLEKCFQQERRLLVELKMEELAQLNLRKEAYISKLVRKRHELKQSLRMYFAVENPKEVLSKVSPEDGAQWMIHWEQWLKRWDEIRVTCVENQKFLEHSTRNIGVLVDQLKSLLGEHSIYSKEGKRVELQSEGKVLQGKY